MRGKSKYTVEELNQRLKKLTGNPDDVDLGKMTVYEVEALISRNRSRMVEIAKKSQRREKKIMKVTKDEK